MIEDVVILKRLDQMNEDLLERLRVINDHIGRQEAAILEDQERIGGLLRAVESELAGVKNELSEIRQLLKQGQTHTATEAVFTLGGNMAGQINVDTENETATLEFEDDHGDVATPPDGAVAVFTSSDVTVLTVANDGTNPFQGDVTPVAVGSASVSVALEDGSGNPFNGPDGQPFPTPDPVTVTVSPGPADTDTLVLSV